MTGGKWLKQGSDVGVPCPQCESPLVHNGNVFCDNYGDTCNFAMPDQYEPAGYDAISRNPKVRATAVALRYERFVA